MDHSNYFTVNRHIVPAEILGIYLWAAILIALATMAMTSVNWLQDAAASLALTRQPAPDVIYEDETQYCYIAVKRFPDKSDKRAFMQDKLKHSEIIMKDINNLQYFYTRIYAAVTRGLSQNKNRLSVMAIGGGGYVFPRYVEKNWPGSHIDVAEIDSAVTEAAMQAFGLNRNTTINTVNMDARNYVDMLLEKKNSGKKISRYDFIYGDAFNDYSVPYQLVTKEFNDKIARLLKEDGAYMLNLIDAYNSGKLLGSVISTLRQTFPNVYALSEIAPRYVRSTFVIIATKPDIDIKNLIKQYLKDTDIWLLDNADFEMLRQKSHKIILTDDYVPVENMLVPVTNQSNLDFLNDRAAIQIQQGRLSEASKTLQRLIEYSDRAKNREGAGNAHLDLAMLLTILKQPEKADEHFRKAIDEFQKELSQNPPSSAINFKLGFALVKIGESAKAIEYLRQALDTDPTDIEKHSTLIQALINLQRYNEATEQLNRSIKYMSERNRKEDVERLQKVFELQKPNFGK